MDYSAIVSLVTGLFCLMLIAILVAVMKSPWFKGKVGESVVNLSAMRMLDKDEYHLIKNVTLPTEEGSTQIDHIIVSVYGIFVLETKNMKGWLFGTPKQRTWTQKIYKHSFKFQNPLYQNYKHVKTIEQLLGLKDEQVHSLVVFVGDSTFKTAMPENVTYGVGYIRYIKSKKQQVLSQVEVAKIINQIETSKLSPSFKTDIEHVNHVKSLVKEKLTHPTRKSKEII